MTTIKEMVTTAVKTADYENDNIKKIIAIAYHMGRESAVKETLDTHNTKVSKARAKAKSIRYCHMVNAVLDAMGGDMIYHPDYSGDMTSTFGDDTTTLEV
jgi:ABC-type Fe3+-citrate transport system substrate-binding protein